FTVNGTPVADQPGTPQGASHTFNMGTDFTPSLIPAKVGIVATNAEGQHSATTFQNVCVEPLPAWVTSSVKSTVSVAGDVEFSISGETPHIGKDSLITIPGYVPLLAGQLGFKEAFASLELKLSTQGTGSFSVAGQLGFTVADQSVTGKITGTGKGSLRCGALPTLDSGIVAFNLQ